MRHEGLDPITFNQSLPKAKSKLQLVTTIRRGMMPVILEGSDKSNLAAVLRPGDWAASIDLKDAYFHVPIKRNFRRYLVFGWKKRLYRFRVLPFGLCVAPRLFTMITKPLKAFLHARGIRSIWYLDDILILGSSEEECRRNVALARDLIEKAGFIINFPKSTLDPAQRFRFLGFLWDTTSSRLAIDDVKRLSMTTKAAAALAAPFSCKRLQILLGHLTASSAAVPLLRLHSRYLQRDLTTNFLSPADATKRVAFSPESRRDLHWIASLSAPMCEAPIWPLQTEDCGAEVSTDASDDGWGIFFEGNLRNGLWAETAGAPAHINAKELMTLLIFLRDFLPPSVEPINLLWRCDSTTAIAYIRKQGGTVSHHLLRIARKTLLLAHRRRIRILPVYVPSEENLLADAASRFQDLPDWHLHPTIFRRIVRLWGLPEVDLFATDKSAHLPRFFAWGASTEAEAFDALAQRWVFDIAYAFPPPALLLVSSRKWRRRRGVFGW